MNSQKPQRRRARQADVARLAGVSQATVSMVLSGTDTRRISEATRARIMQATEELAYSANPSARSLAGGRNRLLGVFTFEPAFPIAGLDKYHQFLVGIELQAQLQRHNLLLFTSATSPSQENSLYADGANLLAQSDGAILLGHGAHPEEMRRLTREGFPFVHIGRRATAEISWVTADYASASYEVIGHLVSALNHRSLLYLGLPEPLEPHEDRFVGWEQARDELTFEATVSRPERAEFDDIISEHIRQGVTALVVETPDLGPAVFASLRRLKVSVPDELSVAVLGDMTEPRRRQRDWTGFHMPFQDIGARAVGMLIDLIEDPDRGPMQERLPCSFAPGRTAIARTAIARTNTSSQIPTPKEKT